MKNYIKAVTLAFAAIVLAPNVASSQTFTLTGNMADNGAYGNVLGGPTGLTSTDASSALRLQVTGWQSNQSNNAITKAWVGMYGPGLGVTGVNDYSGAYGNHQIDNANGYTDFVLLQFNAPVVLSNLSLASFALGTPSNPNGVGVVKDNDFAIYAANVPEAAWNSQLDLTQYITVPSLWTTVSGSGADGPVPTGVTMASREWLVGAAFNSGNNDGFKIASVTVSAVPEPAAWLMMIVGFGAVGFAMRARRADGRGSASRLPVEAEAA